MSATFFPGYVLSSLGKLETALDGVDYHETSEKASVLATNLRHWEREWAADRARLVPQVEAKANGEGGL